MKPKSRTGPARIGDVAASAGVSAATVSRVLNGSTTVSSALAERVLRATEQLAFEPYGPARALRSRRTRVWAVVVADVGNPFFTAMVRGVEDVASANGFQVVLCNSDDDPRKEQGYLRTAVNERMAGVVISVAAKGTDLTAATVAGIPVVAVDRRPGNDQGVRTVTIDTRTGARSATEHLLQIGRSRIACITGPRNVTTAQDRLAGYRDALRQAGQPIDLALVRRADFREVGGYEATLSLLREAEPPDALLVANNLMTLGALRALQQEAVRMPRDLAVVGFDEAPWTTLVRPALSTVEQPTYELGREAGLMLVDLDRASVVLPTTLVTRGSSRR